jgi:proteic killer suppression protein
MIGSFLHKGLRDLYETGSSSKVQKSLVERTLRRLDAINAAKTPETLNGAGKTL